MDQKQTDQLREVLAETFEAGRQQGITRGGEDKIVGAKLAKLAEVISDYEQKIAAANKRANAHKKECDELQAKVAELETRAKRQDSATKFGRR